MSLVFANVASITSGGAFNNDLGTLLGYYQPGDGGGGNLYWDALSTETQDSGFIFKVSGIATGRWKRIGDGSINVKWFGAKGDGVTDDYQAIEKALVYARTNFRNGVTFVFPTGNYAISQTLNFTAVTGGNYYGKLYSWRIEGQGGASLYPMSAITAINIEVQTSYYTGLNISYAYFTSNPTWYNENCVAIYLHKKGVDPNDQVNNTVFECFSIIGAHTGIKSLPDTGVVWNIDFRQIYFDLYEGVSLIKAIAIDIDRDGLNGGNTTIRILKCTVHSYFPTNYSLSRGIGYRGFSVENSSDVYIVDCSYDGYIGSYTSQNEPGQTLNLNVRSIHINGFHSERLRNELDASDGAKLGPFKITCTGYCDIRNIVLLNCFMHCNGGVGAWLGYIGVAPFAPFNFGGYTEFNTTTDDGTQMYVLTFSALSDGLDVQLNRPQIRLDNTIMASQIYNLQRVYNNIHLESLQTGGAVTTVSTIQIAILNVTTKRCSMLVAVRGFNKNNSNSYFIDYILVSRARNATSTPKIKNLINDFNNYSGTNSYAFDATTGDLKMTKPASVTDDFWVDAKVVNII